MALLIRVLVRVWALKNRAALMPTFEQFTETAHIVESAKVQLKGILVIDFVVPDYYAKWATTI